MPLDIGVGLMLGALMNDSLGFSYGTSLVLGVIATLLPDLDYIWKFLRTKHLPHSEHRDLLHYPLLFIPSVGILGYLITPQLGLLLAVGALIHFVHDSVGVGFGIKWLYPFKENSYLFLFQTSTPTNKDMPKQLIYSWNNQERAEMIRKYAYPDWIRHIYFRPHPFGIFEYSVLLLGIVTAFILR